MDRRTGGISSTEREARERERESGRLLFSPLLSSLLAVTRMERRDRAGRTAEAGGSVTTSRERRGEEEIEREREREPPREYRYLLGGPPGPDV
jgi:hypothetical protein